MAEPKWRDEMESAMGPDEEPGEAKPAPAERAEGLGGLGTEGKPGDPEGGTEPQLPTNLGPDHLDIARIVHDIETMPDHLREQEEREEPHERGSDKAA
jgi:hypothetical protein